MKLFFRKHGSGPPMIILHGLFGSSDNWNFQAKNFSEYYSVYLIDQRNHGQSPHDEIMNLDALADDLGSFIQQQGIRQPILLGHSMGGKVVMNFAVRYPDIAGKVIVVDIGPKYYPPHHKHILEGMKKLPLTGISNRSEADHFLAQYISESAIRQFLLKNLVRTENTFKWQINLNAIENNLELLGNQLNSKEKYFGSCLFLFGKKSNYFKEGDEELIKAIFPNSQLSFIEKGGHWLHVECPEEFGKIILSYLADNE